MRRARHPLLPEEAGACGGRHEGSSQPGPPRPFVPLASSLLRERVVPLASSLLREQVVPLARSLLRERVVPLARSLLRERVVPLARSLLREQVVSLPSSLLGICGLAAVVGYEGTTAP